MLSTAVGGRCQTHQMCEAQQWCDDAHHCRNCVSHAHHPACASHHGHRGSKRTQPGLVPVDTARCQPNGPLMRWPGEEPRRPLVVTAASLNHFNALLCLLDSMARNEPAVPVRVYALDSHVAARSEQIVQTNPQAKLRSMSWHSIPVHAHLRTDSPERETYNVTRTGGYAWKPPLIAGGFDEADGVVWLDAGIRLTGRGVISQLLRRASALGGVISLSSGGHISDWTHPGMLRYIYDHPPQGIFGRRPPRFDQRTSNCDGAVVAAVDGGWVTSCVFEAWLACAANRPCIQPVGSNRSNHRHEQAALTVILHDLVARGFLHRTVCDNLPNLHLQTHTDHKMTRTVDSSRASKDLCPSAKVEGR